MSGKANENRFTLLFNPGDPIQKSAVDTLNALGHGKARYIAAAIYYWQHNGAPPVLSLSSPEMTSKIEETLEVLLAKKGIVPSVPSAQQAAARPPLRHHTITSQPDGEGDTEVPIRFLNAMDAFKVHNP